MKGNFSLNDLKKLLFKNMGKDKIIIFIMIGVLLIIITLPTKSSSSSSTTAPTTASTNLSATSTAEYEDYLEQKITKMLSKVDGVGKVNVMVTVKGSSEKKLANEGNYSENSVKETDSDGGLRESLEKSSQQSYLTSNAGGDTTPYVTQELQPEIEGVLVIAEGGANGTVASNITNAISALLSVPVHKIQVLKMSS